MSEFQQFILTQYGADDVWRLEYRTLGSVMPTHEYASARLLLARLAQLLKTGPVAPQLHPERVEIGSIDGEPA